MDIFSLIKSSCSLSSPEQTSRIQRWDKVSTAWNLTQARNNTTHAWIQWCKIPSLISRNRHSREQFFCMPGLYIHVFRFKNAEIHITRHLPLAILRQWAPVIAWTGHAISWHTQKFTSNSNTYFFLSCNSSSNFWTFDELIRVLN